MKWTREEYIELMTFGRSDRQMFVELFGPLIGLEEEWKKQGATEAQINMTAFDWDYAFESKNQLCRYKSRDRFFEASHRD